MRLIFFLLLLFLAIQVYPQTQIPLVKEFNSDTTFIIKQVALKCKYYPDCYSTYLTNVSNGFNTETGCFGSVVDSVIGYKISYKEDSIKSTTGKYYYLVSHHDYLWNGKTKKEFDRILREENELMKTIKKLEKENKIPVNKTY